MKCLLVCLFLLSTNSMASDCPAVIQTALSKNFKILKRSGERINLLNDDGRIIFDPNLKLFSRGLIDVQFSADHKSLYVIGDKDLAVFNKGANGDYFLSYSVSNLHHLLKGDAENAWLYQVRQEKNLNVLKIRFLKKSRQSKGFQFQDSFLRFRGDSMWIFEIL